MKRPLFFILLFLFLVQVNAQQFAPVQGHFGKYVCPNNMGFANLYCGNTTVVPFPASLPDKLRISTFESLSKSNHERWNELSNVFYDSRSMIHEVNRSKDKPCLLNYKIYNGLKSKPDEEITISVSGNSYHVKRNKANKDGTSNSETIWSFFTTDEHVIKQLECYGDKKYPLLTGSVQFSNGFIVLENDTLRSTIQGNDRQFILNDIKNRPVKLWLYDETDRLKKYCSYQYNEMGILRIDSTVVKWENEHVQRINTNDQSTLCRYDSLGNIQRIENFKKGVLVNTYEYRYEFDQKGNWNTFELCLVEPSKNKRIVKYYVKRKITYRDIRNTF